MVSARDTVVSLNGYRPASPSERLRLIASLIAWGLRGDDDRARDVLTAVAAALSDLAAEDGTQ